MSSHRSLFAWALATALLSAGGSAHATGFGGSDAPTRIPVPAEIWQAEVEDLSGTVTRVSRITFNGEVFAYGKHGDATASVPFDRIREVRVEPTSRQDERLLFITLRDGGTVKLLVEDDVPCYAEAPFGYLKLDVGKLRRIVFTGSTPREP
jgi:hypothetical protein